MKRILVVLITGLMLIGVNAYAAGDLQVTGKLGVGASAPLYPMHIVVTDEATALRLEPTINNLAVVSNYAGFYRIVAADTSLPYGYFTGFAGNVSFNGGGIVSRLTGAENNVVLNSGTASTIESAVGNKVELRRIGANGNHTLTDYYGFHSYGTASGSGNISGTSWRHAYFEDFPGFGGTVTNVAGLWVDQQTSGTNNYGIVLDGDGAGADIVFGASQQATIYSSAGLLYATDKDGNITLFSPHDPETGEWIFYSKNTRTGIVKRVNMEKLVKAVEKLTGETFMVETLIEN